MPPTLLRVGPPEGEEVSSPDHWLVPVLSQLWDGCVFSNHQQEPALQAGERDENLYCAAVPRANCPHQGEVNWTWLELKMTDQVKYPQLLYHNNLLYLSQPKRLLITLIY